MTPLIRSRLLLPALLLPAAATAQLPDPLTQFEVSGHVYEPQAVSPADERIRALSVPAGFRIHRFAEGLDNPRMLDVAPDGTVYVTQRKPGNLVMLRDTNRDGVADVQKVVLEIPQLHGIEIRGTQIYLADVKNVYAGELRADGSVTNVHTISTSLPDGGQHPNRTLAFGPDGMLYVSIGSTCNACDETNPENATLVRLNPSNGEREIFATGLRNTIGFGWHPSGRLYGVDHGIDWLGNEEQSEELNEIFQDTGYGWPYVYDEDQLNPQDEPPNVTQLEWARISEEPIAGYTAHSAPMQLAFYEASQFPAEYRGNAFVAMRGSWNRKPPSGYEVVRIRFDDGGEFQGFESFVTGFLVPQPNRQPPLPNAQPYPPEGFLARPVGIAVARDGALLMGDDTNNIIYRVSYGDSQAAPAPQRLAIQLLEATTNQPINVRSGAFAPNARIPEQYTDYGKGISPPLTWSNVPAGTRSLVLMMEDPDAKSPLPFVHWTLINVPPSVSTLPQNIAPTERAREIPGARQGSNSKTLTGYFGPRPPPGDPAHRYHFQVFALDTTLRLPSGFNRHALLRAMEGHVLAKGELIGTFAQKP